MINSDTDLESGFMPICWMSNGQADYSIPPICNNPEEIIFPRSRLPLRVYSAYRDHNLISAIEWVNQSLACNVFQFDGAALHPDVRVYLAVALPPPGRVVGITAHWRLTDGTVAAQITTFMMNSDWSIQYTLQHELLHSIGLSHDDFELSIMWPYARTTTRYVLTTHDTRILRERYCL